MKVMKYRYVKLIIATTYIYFLCALFDVVMTMRAMINLGLEKFVTIENNPIIDSEPRVFMLLILPIIVMLVTGILCRKIINSKGQDIYFNDLDYWLLIEMTIVSVVFMTIHIIGGLSWYLYGWI